MMPSRLSYSLLFAGVIALALAGCGRRGALEQPPVPAARGVQAQTQGEKAALTPAEEAATEAENDSITPTPIGQAKARPRGIIIPKTPFILDPLL